MEKHDSKTAACSQKNTKKTRVKMGSQKNSKKNQSKKLWLNLAKTKGTTEINSTKNSDINVDNKSPKLAINKKGKISSWAINIALIQLMSCYLNNEYNWIDFQAYFFPSIYLFDWLTKNIVFAPFSSALFADQAQKSARNSSKQKLFAPLTLLVKTRQV